MYIYILPLPNGYLKNAWRIHRLVISPDYQGLGVGTKFLETICDLFSYSGGKIYIRTSHIKLRNYFYKNKDLWVETARSGTNCVETIGTKDNFFGKLKNNVAYSFKYIGECKNQPNLKYDKINAIQNSKEKNDNVNYEQLSLFES